MKKRTKTDNQNDADATGVIASKKQQIKNA